MDSFEFHNVKIAGISCVVPGKKVETKEYVGFYDQETVDKFIKTTGIKSRYISNGKQTAGDLCYVAAKNLMEAKNITSDSIDMLILITQYPDYSTPSTAFVLHHRLGIKKDCIVFDINLGCSAFVNGIHIISSMIESGAVNRALLLIGDAQLNHKCDKDDTSSTMMFADSGTACLMERGDDLIRTMVRSDGDGFRTLNVVCPGNRFPDGLGDMKKKSMAGDDTFLFTITEVPKLIKSFMKKYDYTWEDFDYCVLHQANLFILEHIAKRIKVPLEKLPISIDHYGNTDGASILLGIADLCAKEETQEELRLIVSGFGIGLSWGVASFSIKKKDVLPVVVTDEYYEEGFIL